MLEAHSAGATYADIGRAAGVSPQAARVVIERANRSQSEYEDDCRKTARTFAP